MKTPVPVRRPAAASVALAALSLVVAACGSGSKGSTAAAGAAAPTGSVAGAASSPSSPPPAAVPLAEVQQLVAAAPSIKALPANLAPPLTKALSDDAFGQLGAAGCLPTFSTTSLPAANCTFGDRTGSHTLVVLGDSHAAMWLPALDAMGQRTGWKVIDFNKVSCPAADVLVHLDQQNRPYTECQTWHNWVINEINTIKPDIFVATSETGFKVVGPGTLGAGLVKTLESVDARYKVVLGDIAYLQQDGPDCLAAHPSDVQACSTPEPAALNTAGRAMEMGAAKAAGAAYIDVVPWMCSSVCTAVVGNMVVNQDDQHITRTYSAFLSGAVQAALAPEMSAVG